MNDKILLTFLIAELLFLGSGVLLLAFPLVTFAEIKGPQTASSVASSLLLATCPLSASIANAVVVFVTFVLAVPAIIIPTNRGWLKFHGYMVAVCGVFTMVLGLVIWVETLKTRANLSNIWNQQSTTDQSLLQQEFNCCGYYNSTSPPFVVDSTCPDDATAASLPGCITSFSSYANKYLDVVFTAAFGITGLDLVVILATAIIMKDRKEKARYRYIDEKNGNLGAF